jgi:hypothetical protein
VTRFRRVALVVAAPLLGFGLVASGEEMAIHECKDANGIVVFQSEPCPEPAPVTPMAPAIPAAPMPAKPKTKTKQRVQPAVSHAAPPAAPRPAQPARPDHPVDARWGTPESALRTFVSAVKAGDRALALSCLTSSALAELGPGADTLPMDTLRTTVGTFTGYVSEGDVGPFWSIRALRAGTKPKWIFLERTAEGEWKIGGF